MMTRFLLFHQTQDTTQVKFRAAQLGETVTLVFRIGAQTDDVVGPVPGKVIDWNVINGTVHHATIGIDIDNVQAPLGYPAGTKWFDCAASAAEMVAAVRKIVLHETGHPMGLGNVPVGSQQPGATVMNSLCPPNDNCGGMAVNLGNCERSRLNSIYPGDPPCQAPNCPGGSVCGNWITEEGEECDDGNTIEGDGCNSQCQEENGNPPGANCGSIGYELSFYSYSNCFAMCQAQDDHYNICLGSWASDICGGLYYYDLPGECSDDEFRLDQLFGIMNGGASVSLQAEFGLYFVAEGNGAGAVNADRPSPGPWETFTILDLNGGTLSDGDPVAFRTGNYWYFQAVGGGGGALQAIGQDAWAWETFTIINVSSPGGLILDETYIALAGNNGQFVCAEGGGGGTVNVNRNSIGGWETFRIRFN